MKFNMNETALKKLDSTVVFVTLLYYPMIFIALWGVYHAMIVYGAVNIIGMITVISSLITLSSVGAGYLAWRVLTLTEKTS